MDTFGKEDLIYEYAWSPYQKDDPRISGIPDTTEFNRKEGQEVLFIIGSLTDHVAWGVEGFGSKVEKMIHDRLPAEIKNQEEAIRWIKEHWKNASGEKLR
jgi:hypothetical protein